MNLPGGDLGDGATGPVDAERRKREILTNVAAGRLDPSEAGRLLDELTGGGPSTGMHAPGQHVGEPEDEPTADAADPTTATAGPESADRAGEAEAEPGPTTGAKADADTGGTDDDQDPWAAETDDVSTVPPRRTTSTTTTSERVTPGPTAAGPTTGRSEPVGTSTPERGSRSGNGAVAHPQQAAVDRVRIRALGRRVHIIGEPFVSTVAIDGPHVVRTEDDTLVVTSEGEIGASIDGFTLLRTRSLRDVQEQVFDFGRELSVRVNPALAVEVETTAGSLNAERLPKLEHVRVTAGSARLRDVTGPIDLLVQAGSATVEGAVSKGASRLRAESGSLQLHLLAGSDVRIRPDAQLGRIAWDSDTGESERVFGSGAAQLDLEVVMGNIQVKEAA